MKMFFFGGGGCPKIAFLTTWPRKSAPKTHYKIRGFSKAFLEKQLWTKNTNPEISVIIFFAFFFSFNNKNTKISWNPYVDSVLANLKKTSFKILD